MIANVKGVEFPIRGDERGYLIPLEAESEFIPFEIKRVYYIFDTMHGVVRGKHAHKTNKQMLICVNGACTVTCELPNGTCTEYRLDRPSKGLLIEGMVWHELREFSEGAVLLVISSELYSESDYIRDYNQFESYKAVWNDRG